MADSAQPRIPAKYRRTASGIFRRNIALLVEGNLRTGSARTSESGPPGAGRPRLRASLRAPEGSTQSTLPALPATSSRETGASGAPSPYTRSDQERSRPHTRRNPEYGVAPGPDHDRLRITPAPIIRATPRPPNSISPAETVPAKTSTSASHRAGS